MSQSLGKRLAIFEAFVQKYGRLPTEVDPDYLEMLRMSKYRILDVPDYKPGNCANCGSSKNDGRRYIDFGREIDWFGTIFICGFCLQDVANEMGLFQKYVDEIGELKHKLLSINTLEAKGDHIREDVLRTFKEVKEYFDHVRVISDSDVTDDTVSVESVTPEIKSGTDKTESRINETKSRTTKSNSGERSPNIRSLADLLESATE